MSAVTSAAEAGDAAPRTDRDALFRETPQERLRRIALGTAWALKPPRIFGLPGLARMWLADLASPAPGLPDPEAASQARRGYAASCTTSPSRP